MAMLRNNSKRAVSSKQQGLMADNTTSFPISPTKYHTNPPISPRIFNGFLTRSLSDVVEAGINSPKSILDGKQMFTFGNPFGYDRNCPNPITYMDRKQSTLLVDDKLESEGIKLALLLDPIENEEMVLFGTELKVQSPASPTDFGIKTRDSQLLASSFTALKELEKDSSRRGVTDGLSLREMESSEDYTCVITHGPNPKTTHIFDNCVVGICLT
ncbi:PREDICTED: protein MARD1-like [Nicotiana attenuata]|nr:PREDICTED: protein MARD1-like [Nicotiana attenuata]